MQENILYVGAMRFPTGDAAAARVLNNAKIFSGLGYDVAVLSWGGEKSYNSTADGYCCYQGFKYLNTEDFRQGKENLFKRIYNQIFLGKKSLEIIKKSISNYSVIILYNTPYYFSKKLIALCRKNNVKLISDLTEWYSPSEYPGGKLSPLTWMNEINMRIIQKKIANKILISSFLNNYYNTSNNILLPPLTDYKDVKWNLSIELPNTLAEHNFCRFIYAGDPGKKDELARIIKVMISIIEVGLPIQFIILGVSGENSKNYIAEADYVKYDNQIVFLGRVPQEHVPAYYKISDFSILIREVTRKSMAGFPTKFAESMTAGCPVITNKTSDLKDYLVNGVNGFIMDNSTEEELYKVVEKVSSLSDVVIGEMKKNALEAGKSSFYYESYITKTESFLSNLK